ncbi:t-SNARE affecting a late Golgi compartment protein 1 [[Candida] railenensis]|uniref:t-SNARE affecting a late Golgi compartment protein 1 n=1 Tax=[Candida] railenensis TaxID=45579 RepID=A0A9P0W0T5_9ASCO|nr:t-SNARE affecting a late Golgi compartment protein 1 [[Candida] railenensis]
MDPFNDVSQDATSQLNTLRQFLTKSVTPDSILDFDNTYLEIQETLEDLQGAVDISESNPGAYNLTENDISERKRVVSQLKSDLNTVVKTWSDMKTKPTNLKRQREITTMSNRISQDTSQNENPFSDQNRLNDEFQQFQTQEMTQNQDMQLDSIHETMHNLNQQAMMMGQELEEQGYMLDDLDTEMDVVGSKLQRGLKRVNYVIEKNRERASDCCIVLLVIALCVLLVLLLVAS